MAIKPYKANAMLSKLRYILDIRYQAIMQLLNHIYVMPLLLGFKTLIQ